MIEISNQGKEVGEIISGEKEVRVGVNSKVRARAVVALGKSSVRG